VPGPSSGSSSTSYHQIVLLNDVVSWLEAHATLVQAAASVVSVLVTLVLAGIAWRALAAANTQAAASLEQAKASEAGVEASARSATAAARSADELRRQSQLAAVPLLRVGRPQGSHDGWNHPFLTLIQVDNISDVPAIATVAELFGVNDDGTLTNRAMASSPEHPLLAPGDVVRLDIPSDEIHGMLSTQATENEWHKTHHDSAPPHYTYDEWVVRVRCEGIRGARVEHEWRWHANFERQHDPLVWQQVRIRIEPDPEHPDYRIDIPRPDH
jgi:hypothetical protein